MKTPLISVLMPIYNFEKYSPLAIESILNQTFSDFELILIDDASTDRTLEIIREYAGRDQRIKTLQNEKNLNISLSLNRALKIAKGRYTVRLDADDWAYPDRLEKQFQFMEADPLMVLSGGSVEICDQDLKPLCWRRYQLTDKEIRKNIFYYGPFCHSAVIYKTEAALAAGGYDPAINFAQDYDFFFRIGRLGHFGNRPEILIKYRVWPRSVSQEKFLQQEAAVLQIRLKAVKSHGYRMALFDRLFFALQWLSRFLVPHKIRMLVFNFFRNSRLKPRTGR